MFAHLLAEPAQFLAFLRGGSHRGQCGDLHLQHAADLGQAHVNSVLVEQLQVQAQRTGNGRRVGLAYVQAAAGEGLQHPARLQHLDRLAHDGAADAESFGQIALRGQAIARSPGVALDQVDDLVDDSFIQALFAFERCDLEKLGVHGWVLGQDRAKVVLVGSV